MKLKRAAYGLADAPRKWWQKLDRILTEAGWRESKLIRAMYYLWDKAGKLVGIRALAEADRNNAAAARVALVEEVAEGDD